MQRNEKSESDGTRSQEGHLVPCITILYDFKSPNKDINPQVKWAVSLVITAGHCNLPQDVCECAWVKKSLMAEWLGRASLRYEMYCHDLEVMGSNPGRARLWVRGTSV